MSSEPCDKQRAYDDIAASGLPRASAVTDILEADRGTMPVSRRSLARSSFLRKLLAYEATWLTGAHCSRFGLPNFRVLTVTDSERRLEHLTPAVNSLRPGVARALLFSTYGRLRVQQILGPLWTNGRGERVALVRPRTPDDRFQRSEGCSVSPRT